MKYFEKYSSNTTAGSGNQSFFVNDDENKIYVGRIYYKLFAGGRYNYSILFSNTVDSTYKSGELSHKNLVIDEWYMDSLRLGVCKECSMGQAGEVAEFKTATFNGEKSKRVAPGELFYTDGVEICANEGEYLCLEISFHGKNIPHHPETMIPSFVFDGESWVSDTKVPFASMIGCDRPVKKKVAFAGDSITQGIGPAPNSYKHYVALTCDRLDKDNSYWNLGLGYARADDFASDGIWLFKAKQMDVVSVCYGVNDILQGAFTQRYLKRNLTTIIDKLKQNNIKVLLQTIPPFNQNGVGLDVWKETNDFIKNELSKKCDLVFDCVPVLGGDSENPQIAKYEPHPNAEGCEKWAERLAPVIAKLI